MNGAQYTPHLCNLLDLNPSRYGAVLAALSEGAPTIDIADALDLPLETTRSRIRKIGDLCDARAERLPSTRFPIRVAVLHLVVEALEARVKVLEQSKRTRGPWSKARVGERECRLLGPVMKPYTEAAVRLMRGDTRRQPRGFDQTLFEAALPYLERYMVRVVRPIDMRACILAVRASYFEDIRR